MGKQALLVIHGIGEQRPMDTLRSFVQEIWVKDKSVQRHGEGADAVWSKPYPLSENYELRRLTTGINLKGQRTDFFEFYWAHLMQGTKLQHVFSWLSTLLLRVPKNVPPALRTAYFFLWASLLVAAGLAVQYSLSSSKTHEFLGFTIPGWASLAFSVLLLPLVTWVATQIVGDAARYLNVAAVNVQMRHSIRSSGLQVLKELHMRGYDRVIVVGHSLGAVIAYDILSYAWGEWNTEAVPPGSKTEARDALEKLTVAQFKGQVVAPEEFQTAQHAFFNEQVANGHTWRVTDFVTLGSPLAHAQILLARDAGELKRKFQQREYAKSPPYLETKGNGEKVKLSFTYFDKQQSRDFLHHAATFAPTRWTNLYFPCHALIKGDLIGGPVAHIFGAAIKDVPVHTRRALGLVSHTFYWNPALEGDNHIDQLRKAVNLLNTDSEEKLS